MATATQVTITTTATQIVAAVPHETRNVLMHTTGNVFVGGDASVTTSTGFLVDATKSSATAIVLHGGEALFGITTSGSHTAYVLVTEI